MWAASPCPPSRSQEDMAPSPQPGFLGHVDSLELPPSDPLWASAPSFVKMEPWVFTASVRTESGRLW